MTGLQRDQDNVHAAAIVAHQDDAKTCNFKTVLTCAMQPLVHTPQQWPVFIMRHH